MLKLIKPNAKLKRKKMIDLLGQTQRQLLKYLNKNKKGLTISDLTDLLKISRNAVKQHLTALEKNNMIQLGVLQRTAGRPIQNYVLTDDGKELFPRKYSWFAQILLENIRAEKNENGLRKFLDKIGASISAKYLPDLEKLQGKPRLKKVAAILTELGYEAEVVTSKDKAEISKLEISNCIFQHLASTCPEICSFDLGLLTTLTGQKIEQQSCIAHNGNVCCFGVKK
jgi:predicted ArsR family transcriptional regulator